MSDYNSSLPVRTQNNGDVAVKVVDGLIPSQQLAIDSSGRVVVKIQDASGSDISQTAGALNVSLRDEAGNAYSNSNPLQVTVLESEGVEVNNYDVASAIAVGATANHDYVVTAGKTLQLSQFHAAASGKMKVEVQVETAVASGVFLTKWVFFNSTANPNTSLTLKECISVLAGVKVRIAKTNKDSQAQDLYSTISGHEN